MPFRFYTTVDVSELDRLNTTSYRAVVGVRVSVAVIAVAMGAFVCEEYAGHHDPAMNLLEYVLIYLGTLTGLSVGQYGLKRFSNTDMIERRETAKAGTAPTSVVQTTGPVVQQTPGGTATLGDTTNTTTTAAAVPARPAPDADQGTPDVLAGSSERDEVNGIEPAP